MQMIINTAGIVACLYDETIELAAIGQLTIARASYVEPMADGQWCADLSPVGGPQLGPFAVRSQALAAEIAWLESHWLEPSCV